MARFIDCGICGFYIDLFRGLRWYEMDRTTRRAFLSDKEHNPPGHNPGTGHWNKIMCAKYLQEWADLDDNDRSRRSVMESLLKDRDSNGFAEYRAGLTPQEHPLFSGSDDPSTPKQLDYDGFLSHSSRDDELAQRIKSPLESSNIRTFATPTSIPSGLWNPQIEHALQRSHHLWLLLTPAALDTSIWAHQEFGYFYGHKMALSSEDPDQLLHYFEDDGNSRRPGMYAHFQATPVQSFDDPIALARIIANSLGREFREPEDPDAWLMQASPLPESPPEVFDDFSMTSVSTSGDVASRTATAEISINTPITLFNVCATGWHPHVTIRALTPEPQISKSTRGQVKLKLEWIQNESPPTYLTDSLGRQFTFKRPRDPGVDWQPLYITFDAERHGSWALVTYFRVTSHQKGFPEFTRIPATAPFGWVGEQKST